VRAAGGATSIGDEKRAYVIQPNGKIEARERILWIFARNPIPRGGATIVVPTQQEVASTSERLTVLVVVAQSIAALATVIAVIR
jgi:hypothetical protein